MHTLHSLDENEFGDRGSIALAAALEKNQNLRVLK